MQPVAVPRAGTQLCGDDGEHRALVLHGRVVPAAAATHVLQQRRLEVARPHDEVPVAIDDHPMPSPLVHPEQLHTRIATSRHRRGGNDDRREGARDGHLQRSSPATIPLQCATRTGKTATRQDCHAASLRRGKSATRQDCDTARLRRAYNTQEGRRLPRTYTRACPAHGGSDAGGTGACAGRDAFGRNGARVPAELLSAQAC